MKQAVILFAHGSRDPEWARPFERIAEELKRRLPDALVGVAYLEAMRPTLAEAVASLRGAGVRAIRVVPVFFGHGGHIKQDLPRLVADLAAAHREVDLRLEKPIGEQPAVIAAIADAIARGT